jgi:hypothetical protein
MTDGHEVVLDVFTLFATDGVFSLLLLKQMLAGVATDGPLSVGRLGGCPTPNARQMSGGGPPLKFYKDRDNSARGCVTYLHATRSRQRERNPGVALACGSDMV